MANPQIENGYTKIANELLDEYINLNLSTYQNKIFWFIVRKTYGFNKKSDWISQTQIAEGTGINRTHVSKNIKLLLARNIITKDKKKFGVQKDYDIWIKKLPVEVTNEKLPKQVTKKKLPIQVTKVTNLGNKKLPVLVHTKDNKETIQKKCFDNDTLQVQISKYFYSKLKEVNPYIKYNKQMWANHIDALLNIDKANPDHIQEVIDWVITNDFWLPMMYSTKQLRDKFGQLYQSMLKDKKSKPKEFTKKLKVYNAEEDNAIKQAISK